jgi:5-methylcytosine-specific restriction protein B
MPLDKRIREEIWGLYEKLEHEELLLSEEQLSPYLDAFRNRFGPDKLIALDGQDLLQNMHSHANDESLVYWLEFKRDKEFDTRRFGSIRGGSALKFGIYRNAQTGAWMGKGAKGAPAEIPLEQAIEAAKRHRDQLVEGCNLLEALPDGGNDADYEDLQDKMDTLAPDVSRLAWGHKYFSLLYPDKLDDYHNPHYQRYHLIKLLQLPPASDGRYAVAGRYVDIANELGVPIVNLTRTLNDRDGDPHRYWRVSVNYSGLGQEWINWPAMRDGGFVAIGWEELGDLSEIVSDKAGKEKLRSMMKAHYKDPGR